MQFLLNYEKLEEKIKETSKEFNKVDDEIKEISSEMEKISTLQNHITNFSKTKELYLEYRGTGYKQKFKKKHEKKVLIHQEAKAEKEKFKNIKANIDNIYSEDFEDGQDEYISENIFFVPESARWSIIVNSSSTEEIGIVIDNAMCTIENANPTTLKLAKMNLAIRGIEANLDKFASNTFFEDQHKQLKAKYIMANLPFNLKNRGYDFLKNDKRFEYGLPPEGNANYAWIQHMIHH